MKKFRFYQYVPPQYEQTRINQGRFATEQNQSTSALGMEDRSQSQPRVSAAVNPISQPRLNSATTNTTNVSSVISSPSSTSRNDLSNLFLIPLPPPPHFASTNNIDNYNNNPRPQQLQQDNYNFTQQPQVYENPPAQATQHLPDYFTENINVLPNSPEQQ